MHWKVKVVSFANMPNRPIGSFDKHISIRLLSFGTSDFWPHVHPASRQAHHGDGPDAVLHIQVVRGSPYLAGARPALDTWTQPLHAVPLARRARVWKAGCAISRNWDCGPLRYLAACETTGHEEVAHIGNGRRLLSDANRCYRMLSDANICWWTYRMLIYANGLSDTNRC